LSHELSEAEGKRLLAEPNGLVVTTKTRRLWAAKQEASFIYDWAKVTSVVIFVASLPPTTTYPSKLKVYSVVIASPHSFASLSRIRCIMMQLPRAIVSQHRQALVSLIGTS